MIDAGTNTSDIAIEPTRSGVGPSHRETKAETSIPIVDFILPSGLRDPMTIQQVNLSVSGYQLDSLRAPGIGSSPVGTQEASVIPQLDVPRSIPMREHARVKINRSLD